MPDCNRCGTPIAWGQEGGKYFPMTVSGLHRHKCFKKTCKCGKEILMVFSGVWGAYDLSEPEHPHKCLPRELWAENSEYAAIEAKYGKRKATQIMREKNGKNS